jgi:hypothetical protein
MLVNMTLNRIRRYSRRDPVARIFTSGGDNLQCNMAPKVPGKLLALDSTALIRQVHSSPSVLKLPG